MENHRQIKIKKSSYPDSWVRDALKSGIIEQKKNTPRHGGVAYEDYQKTTLNKAIELNGIKKEPDYMILCAKLIVWLLIAIILANQFNLL